MIVLISPACLREPSGEWFLASVLAFARAAHARCAVQVDHVDDLDLIAHAFDVGASAVMADGSRLPLDANIELVRSATELARRAGAAVEAELGRVEGNEDVATAARDGRLTAADQVRGFVELSGAHCLAVSIGNAHGRYLMPPELDLGRLRRIRAESSVPLALHGASGLPDASIAAAIRAGIAKLNVNTDLREAYLSATAGALHEVSPPAAVLDLHRAQRRAVAAVVSAKLALYSGQERSWPDPSNT